MPFSVRCYIFGLVAVAVSVVATLPLSKTQLPLLLALCALVIAAELVSRVEIGTSGWTMSVSLVVTLITILVLAPPAAALVGLISSVPLSRQPSWTWAKQIVNCAMSSLVPAAGAAVCHLAGGHAPGHFLNFPEFLWPSAAAVTTCLVFNGLIIAGYVGLATHTRFVDALRGDLKRATMPYYSSGVLALIFLSLWHDIGWYTAPLVVVPMYIAHWSLSQYAKEGAAHEGTIAALVQAVEIKDSYTRGHSERVARGAEMLAQQLKMPQDRLAMLRFAGLLHDIGKLGVPTRLLTSTGGLTEEEFKLLCMHPNHGVAVLRDIRFLTEVYEGVLYHHERLDGRGYPTGKSGEEIPEFARIIGVADAFDAMTSTRSYRAARSVAEAVAELRRGAGTQFDPDLVLAFERALEFAERSGVPWVPTELAPAEPRQDDGTAAAATGPWPLPKRVPGFSFADHDDPFVPVEWFSDWYPSWLAHGGEPGAPGIPGQRAAEPEPDLVEPGFDDAGFDDGWSERMHSAVVREPGPEPDEGWAWDGAEGDPAGAADADDEAVAQTVGGTVGGAVGEPAVVSGRGSEASDSEPPQPSQSSEPSEPSKPSEQSEAAEPDPEPSADASARWPEDPGLHSGRIGSMRMRGMTSAASPDPRGTSAAEQDVADVTPAADFDLRMPIVLEPVGDCGDQDGHDGHDDGDGYDDRNHRNDHDSHDDQEVTVSTRRAKPGDPDAWTPSAEPDDDHDDSAPVHRVKPGDPEAWNRSSELWAAPEAPAEASKPADPAAGPASASAASSADSDNRSVPAVGPSWFSRGSAGASPTLHFFASADPGPWPPHDPDAQDAEEPPA